MRKKFLKSEFQLVFEFVNKDIFLKSEMRTIASVVDMYVIEYLSKFELIGLPSLLIEHMHKIVNEKEIRHSMPYGYFLRRVFHHFRVVNKKETPKTVKQMFSMETLIEINV